MRSSNAKLLDLIDAAITERSSSAPWSFKDVAPAAGMSPAGLVKRFGSKEGLLLALTQRWVDQVPTRPLGAVEPVVELRGYIEDNFNATSSSAAIFGLGELMRDLSSPTAATMLRGGWGKQANYFAALLARLPLRADIDLDTASLTLLDALHGSLFRRAVGLDPTAPADTLDNFLKGWT